MSAFTADSNSERFVIATHSAYRTYEAAQVALTSSVVANGFSNAETMCTIDGVYNVTQTLSARGFD